MTAETPEAWLERMDDLRYEDAEKALEELHAGIGRVPRRLDARDGQGQRRPAALFHASVLRYRARVQLHHGDRGPAREQSLQ